MWEWIVSLVGGVLLVFALAHAAWVVYYALTRARVDQQLRDYVQR